MTPFLGEKNTNWEGGYRAAAFVRWPGKIPAGSVSNEIVSHLDWLPTLMAAAGEADIGEKLKKGHRAGNSTYKVHLDGYNMLPHITGKEANGPRNKFFYFSDDGLLTGVRIGRWKLVFAAQRARQMAVWREPFVELRIPLIFDLRMDPYERAELDSHVYNHWYTRHQFSAMQALPVVTRFVSTFKEFPARQVPGSFNVDHITKMIRLSAQQNK